MNIDNTGINFLTDLIEKAGKIILDVYHTDFDVDYKEDESPLTIADQRANDLLVEQLSQKYPSTNFITEETQDAPYTERKSWEDIWIIDPLDGTKEFVKKNGEFTVNIALANQNEIVLGMILVPVTGDIYYAVKGKGAFKISDGEKQQLNVRIPNQNQLVAVASRSHRSQEVDEYVNQFSSHFKEINYKPAGSSLKLCLVAEGKAHLYPRLGPTMEWDTAAGHIIATEAGATITRFDNGKKLTYNKENLLNPYFIVSSFNIEDYL